MNSQKTDGCLWCGLPVPQQKAQSAHPAAEENSAFCCVGCRTAAAIMGSPDNSTSALITRLVIATFFTLNVVMLTMALWVAEDSSQESWLSPFVGLLRYLGLLGTLPVIALLGTGLFAGALDDLRQARLTGDLLLSVGVLSAFISSAIATFAGHGGVYFEVACTTLLFVTIGRWLEARMRVTTTAMLDELTRLLPERALRHSHSGWMEVPIDELRPGDRVRVRAGDRFPTDGRLFSEEAQVDEQILTGESWGVPKRRGATIHGGTVCCDGDAEIEVTALPHQGTLARILENVHRARETRGYYARLADRLSRWLLPVVMTLAVAAAVVHGISSDWQTGTVVGLAVLLIACPCSFALATPLAIWTGLNVAAKHQVLFRDSESLERLSQADIICFDKTGTLTTGEPHVSNVLVAEGQHRSELLRVAGALAANSPHVLAQAIARFSNPDQPVNHQVETRQIPGRGVEARAPINGKHTCRLGSLRWFAESGFEIPNSLTDPLREMDNNSGPLVLVGWDGHARGGFVLEETLRSQIPEALQECRQWGCDMEVLTGDSKSRGERLGRELHVPVHAELLPEDKLARIQTLRAQHKQVVMVGDGLNDAGALAAAEVGMALGCGADLTRDAAHVCLLTNDLLHVPWSIRLSRETVRVIRRNLWWSLAYNAIGLCMAVSGWLHPGVAAGLMLVSSLYVLANSRRLAGFSGPSLPELATPRVRNGQTGHHSPAASPDSELAEHSDLPELFAPTAGATA